MTDDGAERPRLFFMPTDHLLDLFVYVCYDLYGLIKSKREKS